jgi:hypothetical protein
MLAAELKIVPHVRGSQRLVVTNFGPSIARNIWVTFNPLLPDPDPAIADQSVTPFLKRRYASPIAFLAPGMSLENIYFSGRDNGHGKWENFEPLPDKVRVTIVYEDTNGVSYRDVFPLDVGLIRNTTTASSSTAPEAQTKKMVKAIEAIERHLRP